MLLHTPKSSRLAPYIPQKAPEALKSGTKNTPVSPSAHSVPTKRQHPTPPGWCPLYLQRVPFLEGQLILLRRLEAVQGHRLHGSRGLLEGSRGCLGLAARGALGSGLRTRCCGGQETALMSALPGHHAGPQLPRCAAGAGESCQPPPGARRSVCRRMAERIWRSCAVSGGQRPGREGNGMVMGWARVEGFGKVFGEDREC